MNKKSFKQIIIDEVADTKKLLRSVPSLVMIFFVIGTVAMNLLANREFNLHVEWIALDCGFTMSWLSFLCMDIIAKRFGGVAAFKLSLIAEGVNLFLCLVFYIVMLIPGTWGEAYLLDGSVSSVINAALDNTFSGTWFVIFGSTVAFIVSSGVNSIINMAVAHLEKKDNFLAYAARSWISTAAAQFVDNLLFASIVSYHFFGWTLKQVITCSITGAIVELLCEVIFSPLGYRVCKKWQKEGVGDAYFQE